MKLKKLLSVVVSAVMSFTFVAACAPLYSARMTVTWENEFISVGGTQSGDFIYELDSDGSAVLTHYTGKETSVTVPEMIDGYKVETLIGTFEGNKTVKEVTLPENISVDWKAFDSAKKLKTVNNLNKAYSIGEDAFRSCSALKKIKLGKSLHSLDSSAFEGTAWYNNQPAGEVYYGNIFVGVKQTETDDVKILNIKEGTTLIPSFDSYTYANIKEVVLPASVKYISDRTFKNKYITKLTGGEGVTYIGKEAFACTNIKEMLMSDTVTEVGEEAFCGCTKLSKLILSENLNVISDYAFCGTAISKVTIPKSVTVIGNGAFSSYTASSKLKTVVIKGDVQKIGQRAFYNCLKLSSINIPDAVKSIGQYAFYKCTSLKSVKLPAKLKKIDCSSFEQCSSLESTEIPDSVTKINCGAFQGCKSLRSVKLPKNLKKLGELSPDLEKDSSLNTPLKYDYKFHYGGVFQGCKKLESIELPEGLELIGHNAFYGCSSLKKVDIPESVKYIDEEVFYKCSGLESITLPGKVTAVKDGLFDSCKNLKTVTLSDNIKKIGVCAFFGCTSLTKIKLPNTVTAIEENAFTGCTSLKSVGMSEKISYILDGAFSGCTALKKIKLPGKTVKFGSKVMENTAWLNSRKNGFVYLDNVLYGYKGKMPKNTKLKIKKGTLSIAGRAFEEQNNLVSAVFSGTEKYIGKNAFLLCKNLAYVKTGKNLMVIDNSAFNSCQKLSQVKLYSKVKTIGSGAFCYCRKLSKISLPDTVVTVGDFAFCDCEKFKLTKLPKKLKDIGHYAFNSCITDDKLTFSKAVAAIGANAFENTNLKSVVINNPKVVIYREAFKNCKNLSSVKYSSKIYMLEPGVFDNTPWYKNYVNKHKNQIIYIGKCAYDAVGNYPKTAALKNGTKGICLDNAIFDELTVPDSVQYIWYQALYYLFDNTSDFPGGYMFTDKVICSRGSVTAKHALSNYITVQYDNSVSR